MKASRAALNIYPKSFLLPAFLIYTALFVVPSLIGFYYALTNWNNFSDKVKFIGLDNFKYIFLDEGATYLKFLGNTLVFAVVSSVLLGAIGLLLALLLNKKFMGRNVLRSIYFVPQAVSPIIIGIIFVTLLEPEGFVNNMLRFLNLESWARNWLVDTKWAMPAVISAEVWRYFGVNTVIFLAGLQTIDKAYYEAAEMDGANARKKFFHITLPFIMPALTINTVLNIIHGFRVFDIIFALTNGGPGNTTEVLNTAVYREFSGGDKGLATALSLVVFILTTATALIVYKFTSRKEIEL